MLLMLLLVVVVVVVVVDDTGTVCVQHPRRDAAEWKAGGENGQRHAPVRCPDHPDPCSGPTRSAPVSLFPFLFLFLSRTLSLTHSLSVSEAAAHTQAQQQQQLTGNSGSLARGVATPSSSPHHSRLTQAEGKETIKQL